MKMNEHLTLLRALPSLSLWLIPAVVGAASHKSRCNRFCRRHSRWIGEYKNGLPTYRELLAQSDKHPIEEVGARSRSLMPWVQKKNIKGAQAAY